MLMKLDSTWMSRITKRRMINYLFEHIVYEWNACPTLKRNPLCESAQTSMDAHRQFDLFNAWVLGKLIYKSLSWGGSPPEPCLAQSSII